MSVGSAERDAALCVRINRLRDGMRRALDLLEQQKRHFDEDTELLIMRRGGDARAVLKSALEDDV